MKKILILIIFLVSLLSIASCTIENDHKVQLLDYSISHETKFGGIYVNITIDDFNKLGFRFGDSLDVRFSNGFELLDLPYYNGYYTNTGDPLLVGYPGYPYIRVGINNGDDLFILSGVTESDTATITIHERAKYKDIQEALDIHYSDVQGDLPDYVFGNYRRVNVGNLKENILYRSASPIDNQHCRAHVVDTLIDGKVNTILNLSDNDSELVENIKSDDFNSPYFLSLYNKGNVVALSMNMNFQLTEEDKTPSLFDDYLGSYFSDKLVEGLRFMISHEGPYLVHCVEGKDRTGFVCMVIEALAGASYQEIIDDYMITYDNYYGITLEKDSSKYNIIKQKNIEEMLRVVINDDTVDIKTADYNYYCKEYLLSKGLELEEIQTLETILTK